MVTGEPKSLGQRIRQSREKRGLSVQELADRAGCVDEYLEWVEDGQVEPSVGLLIQLAKTMHLDSGTFLIMHDTTDQRLEEAAKRTEHYSYKTLTPPEADKHLMAFSIRIPPKTVHKGVSYSHEGEEFVYVTSGEVEITVDKERKKLAEKESLRFNAYLDHHLSNPGEKECELLVVLYTP
ncbi:MAG: helix-turn-helix transcriptional regulator [Desulfobacterales bacterium]|nr:helix-turn-helix transcriptional regulator [Desulfobacterales bacterium]MBL7204378.1 helix-turn-helix transcriptional regulator [Desulfobacteraceae bacterium]